MIPPNHLIQYFRNHAGIAAAVGSLDVRGADWTPVAAELPNFLAAAMPRRALIVTSSGGPDVDGVTHNHRGGTNDVRCYGANVSDAWQLAEVVYNALKRAGKVNAGGEHVISIRPSGGGVQGRDPEGDWPFVFLEFQMVISEV